MVGPVEEVEEVEEREWQEEREKQTHASRTQIIRCGESSVVAKKSKVKSWPLWLTRCRDCLVLSGKQRERKTDEPSRPGNEGRKTLHFKGQRMVASLEANAWCSFSHGCMSTIHFLLPSVHI